MTQHAEEQRRGRHAGQPEHQRPVPGPGQPVVDQVGDQNAGAQGQLVEADQRAAESRRGGFADIHRHHHRGRPYAQADHHLRGQQENESRRERGRQDTGHKQRRGDQYCALPADTVGYPARADSTHCRARQEEAGDQFFLHR